MMNNKKIISIVLTIFLTFLFFGFNSSKVFASVSTLTTTTLITSITSTTAIGGGNISSNGGETVTVSGIVWDTSINPTTALATKTTDGWAIGGPWTSSMTGLTFGTLYHVRAYATNNAGTSYGADVIFMTLNVSTLTTSTVGNITTSTATGGGIISSNGGATVTVSGIAWDTSVNPTTALATKTTDGWAIGGPWSSNITGLTANTFYHVRAYATNSVGTSYGSDVTFTTCTSGTYWNGSICVSGNGGSTASCSEVKANTTTIVTASKTSMYTGDSAIITWSSQNASSCTATNFNNNGAVVGSSSVILNNATGITVTPSSTTTYTIVCQGNPVSTSTVTITVKKRPRYIEL
jgi:hypothetical protein